MFEYAVLFQIKEDHNKKACGGENEMSNQEKTRCSDLDMSRPAPLPLYPNTTTPL